MSKRFRTDFKPQEGSPGETDRDRNMIRDMWPQWTLSQKIAYIRNYYGTLILVVLAVFIAGIFLVRDILSPKPEDAFYVMVLEGEADEQIVNQMKDDLMELFELDPQTQRVVIESGYTSSVNVQSEATIFTYLQAGRVDVMIAPEEVFNDYAASGYILSIPEAGLDHYTIGRTDQELFYAVPVDYSSGGAVWDIPFAPHTNSEDALLYGIYIEEGPYAGYVIGALNGGPNPDRVDAGIGYFLEAE